MDKKITRRAVLGTAVVALAAGPFAIRALRKGKDGVPLNEDVALEDRDFFVRNGFRKVRSVFFDEWKSLYGGFAVPFERDDNVDTVEIGLNFSPTRNWHFRNLSTSISGRVASPSECTPNIEFLLRIRCRITVLWSVLTLMKASYFLPKNSICMM